MNKATLGFTYVFEIIDKFGNVRETVEAKNLIPTEGINYILSSTFKGGAQYTHWYLGLYSGSHSIIDSDTMATLLADCNESQAYTGSTRPEVLLSSPLNGAVSSLASPNELAFPTGASIRGAFISSSNVQLNTGGLLISLVQFTSPLTIGAGESVRVPAGFAFISA